MNEPLLRRLAKGAIFCVFLGAGIAGFLAGNPAQKLHATEDEACRARCSDIQKLHRLVPASPPTVGRPGKTNGRWNCECY